MRRKLALAVAAVAAAATLGPVSNASAFCIGWYQDLTGDCNPCDEVQAAGDRVLGLAGQQTPGECLD